MILEDIIIIVSWPLIVVLVMDGDWKKKQKRKMKRVRKRSLGFRSRVFHSWSCASIKILTVEAPFAIDMRKKKSYTYI